MIYALAKLSRRLFPALALISVGVLFGASLSQASDLCPDEQPLPQIPENPGLCAALDPIVRKPSALPLDQYEAQLGKFLGAYCHRNLAAGWKMDKTVRDTGPFIATLANGAWSGSYNGTHMPVLVWYSPDMVAWLRANRPTDPAKAPAHPAPIPDGAIMVKEMYNSTPASACRVPDLLRLSPKEQGAAVMVRDSAAARDGWFWGWFGWPGSGWRPDWPAQKGNPPPFMGFGQYCTNCHASARDNATFASLNNIRGEPGTFLGFLSQDFFLTQNLAGQPSKVQAMLAHPLVRARVPQHLKFLEESKKEALRAAAPQALNTEFLALLGLRRLAVAPPGLLGGTLRMPSQTYDNVWVPGNGPDATSAFVTSDQCLGCHSAGGTGLQYPMTGPAPASPDNQMFNFSPYGTWRTSPMGLAGRDPIFFAQLASETQTFHRDASPVVQDTCLGCHGIMGQRAFNLDASTGGPECRDFLRDPVNAVPYPADNPTAPMARFGALARDGVSCLACHHMVLGAAESAQTADQPQNRCVAKRQDFLNPDMSGFARTFTGSFLVGPADTLYGPFDKPKTAPMRHALGITPEHSATILSSEACGTCHTVHLPIMAGTKTIGYTYEQTTYPEWAFSAYRTGETPDGKLPFGAGALAQTCQGCHMPKSDPRGTPFRSKIAGIQEHSSFPEVENGLPATDVDLPIRVGFAKHSLVGLNVFLIEMASQFPEVLGMRTEDPMMGSQGVAPLALTEQTMLDQASSGSATIAVSDVSLANGTLHASVAVTNKTGHKFPSGVGFRRAFIHFRVLDQNGNPIWESGRTNSAGVIVDQAEQPIAGELWWKDDCSARLYPDSNPHQPHYRSISRQDQAQIYQELVTAPPTEGTAQCGHDAPPAGALTTSFLSICAPLKDNRLLPHGYLTLPQRTSIAKAIGAGVDLAEDTDPVGVGDDPDYRTGGGDSVAYDVKLGDLSGQPAAVEATLYYQAAPPFYLQDRFCTATGDDTQRLAFIASGLKLTGTRADGWKLDTVSTGRIPVPR